MMAIDSAVPWRRVLLVRLFPSLMSMSVWEWEHKNIAQSQVLNDNEHMNDPRKNSKKRKEKNRRNFSNLRPFVLWRNIVNDSFFRSYFSIPHTLLVLLFHSRQNFQLSDIHIAVWNQRHALSQQQAHSLTMARAEKRKRNRTHFFFGTDWFRSYASMGK